MSRVESGTTLGVSQVTETFLRWHFDLFNPASFDADRPWFAREVEAPAETLRNISMQFGCHVTRQEPRPPYCRNQKRKLGTNFEMSTGDHREESNFQIFPVIETFFVDELIRIRARAL